MRLNPRVFIKVLIPTAMLFLIIGYQNFSDVAPTEWDSKTALQVIHEMQEFERNDPGVHPALAVPEGGHDFTSVRNNWAERQSKILLNGFDKKVEDAVNEKLNSYIQALSWSEPTKETPKDSSAPAKASRNTAAVEPVVSEEVNFTAMSTPVKPRNALKFPRPNNIRYELSKDSRIDLIANPGDTRLNYSQAYNERTKIGVEHSTASQQTQMFLRYDW